MTQLKRGRFTKAELAIIENMGKGGFTAEKIAIKLNRSVDSVIERMQFSITDSNNDLDIRESDYWSEIKKQFNTDEQKMFIFHWKEMLTQFAEDVPHTEKMQIIDLIKVDIIMNRMLTQEKEQKDYVAELQVSIEKEKDKPNEDQDLNYIFNLEKQIGFAYASQDNLHKQYEKLLTDKKQMLGALKGTREQRIKRIEDSKETIVGWLRRLLSETEMRLQVGRDMEKMRLAMQVELERLSEWHKYEDGELDQPFLTPETVIKD
jgi:hypothetical protein